MKKALKTQPYDVAQITVLIDRSLSMIGIEDKVRESLVRVVTDSRSRPGAQLAIRQFNERVETLIEFGDEKAFLPAEYRPSGRTGLFHAIRESIQMSRIDAALTPELRVHHVVVVITDGEDTEGGEDECQREIKAIDVDATFIMLDFSGTGHAGTPVGLKGIPIKLDPKGFVAAMSKVSDAMGKIAENIVNELPPQTGLALPRAR